jgi:hypothetical protein
MTTDLIINSVLQRHQSNLVIEQAIVSLGLTYSQDAATGSYSICYKILEFSDDLLLTIENDWGFTRLVCRTYLPLMTIARVHRSNLIDRVAQANGKCLVGFFSIYESENALRFNFVLPIEYECANLVSDVVKRVIDSSIDQISQFSQNLLFVNRSPSPSCNTRFNVRRQSANDLLFEIRKPEFNEGAISHIDAILTAAYLGRGLKLHQSGSRRVWKQTLSKRRIGNSEIKLKLDAQSVGLIDVVASMKAANTIQVNSEVLEFIALFNEETIPFVHLEYVEANHICRIVGQMLYTNEAGTLSEEMVNRMLGICSNTLWSLMPHIREVEGGLKSPYRAFAEYAKACHTFPECLSSIRHWPCLRDRC